MPERELAQSAAELTKSVKLLTDAVSKLMARTERSERAILLTIVTLVIDVVLTVVVGASIWGQFATNTKVDAALRQQEITTNQVLCPLYAVFIGSYNPESRAPGTDRETYESNFQVIREGYEILRCTTPIVPPATRAPTTPTR